MKPLFKFGCIALLSCFCLVNARAQQAAVPVVIDMPKAPAGVVIDGQITEWPSALFTYNKENDYNYAIASDDTYLYVISNITSNSTRRKVLGAGMVISINTEGKKRKTYSLTYPTSLDPELSFVAKLQRQAVAANAVGFKGVNDVIALPESHGLNGSYKINDDTLVCETAIPLKLLNLKPGDNQVNVNITFNALDKSSVTTTQMVSETTVRTSGGGGGGRGGRSGGGGAPGISGRGVAAKGQDMFTETNFWTSYKLTVR